MKRYKLLKDLPTFKAGDLFYISEHGALVHDGGDVGVTAYARRTLDKFPEILTEWFEEIQEEPTDSIHWEPLPGDIYWFVGIGGKINHDFWTGTPADFWRYGLGRIYRTKEECRKSRERELAEVRLRRKSNFKPDFKNGKGGWIVGYDHQDNKFLSMFVGGVDYGEPVHYKTKEEAERSIKENREDWLAYFNVEDC